MSYNIGDTIIDGTTQYTIKEFVASSNTSTIIKSIRILRDIDTEGLNIYGGTDYGHGANLVLRGKDHNTEPGYFNINAHNGTKVKTLLGTADGTLTWNNENIMTDKKLGYRQPNTSYSIGNIAYHNNLPISWYLECITAGTSSNNDLTISTPAIGNMITDGTIVWNIKNHLNSFNGKFDIKLSGVISDCNDFRKPGIYNVDPSTKNCPVSYGYLKHIDILDYYIGYNGAVQIVYGVSPQIIFYRMNFHGTTSQWSAWRRFSTDIDDEAISAKSFNINGYIKYMSGLIIQWGNKEITNTSETIAYNASYTNANSYTFTYILNTDKFISPISQTNNGFSITIPNGYQGYTLRYLSIGY